jgi:hypothetical protein
VVAELLEDGLVVIGAAGNQCDDGCQNYI